MSNLPVVEPSNSVVHLSMSFNEVELAVGSGVLYQRNGAWFIVTAWHNITGRHAETLKLLSPNLAIPSLVTALISCRVTTESRVSYARIPFTIPLEDQGKAIYFIHPQAWPRVDVVAIPLDVGRIYPTEMSTMNGQKLVMRLPLISPENQFGLSRGIDCIQDAERGQRTLNGLDIGQMLSLGDDLFIMGYPKGMADLYGQPIWKRATVASDPQRGIDKLRKFYVDCASREGMSGAPAIFYHKSGNISHGGAMAIGMGPLAYLHGIYASRVGKTTDFEAQIGTVWGRGAIDEIIDGGIQSLPSADIPMPLDEVRAVIESKWPDSSSFIEMALNVQHGAYGFASTVLEHVQGRANPNDVIEAIRNIASRKKSERANA